MKKKPSIFLVIALITVGAHSSVIWAKESASTCAAEKAIYKPHPSISSRSQYEYTLTIDPEAGLYPGSPLAKILIHLFDKKSKVLLSTTALEYTCIATGLMTCYGFIHNTAEKYTQINMIALNKDFSVSTDSVTAKKSAPYALVFPTIGTRLYHFEWRPKPDAIEYFTEEKVAPILGTPEVWILDRCDRKRDDIR